MDNAQPGGFEREIGVEAYDFAKAHLRSKRQRGFLTPIAQDFLEYLVKNDRGHDEVDRVEQRWLEHGGVGSVIGVLEPAGRINDVYAVQRRSSSRSTSEPIPFSDPRTVFMGRIGMSRSCPP